jgi:hypothetical protein
MSDTPEAPVNCPYCLTPVKVYRESRFAEWDKTATWQVRCDTCWCAAPLAPTPEYAVDRWNELGAAHWRSIAAARVAQVQRLRADLDAAHQHIGALVAMSEMAAGDYQDQHFDAWLSKNADRRIALAEKLKDVNAALSAARAFLRRAH